MSRRSSAIALLALAWLLPTAAGADEAPSARHELVGRVSVGALPSERRDVGYRSLRDGPPGAPKVYAAEGSPGAAAAPGSLCPAPCDLTQFEGIGNLDDLTPGDPTGAAGDSHVFVAVNVHAQLFDKTGTSLLGPLSLGSLFGGPPDLLFDPRVVFDQYRDTFVLAFLGERQGRNRSHIYLVSIPEATADDTGTWCGTKVNGDQSRHDGAQFADYTGLGYDHDRVYVGTNQFGFDDKFFGAQIIVFNKDILYDCTRSLNFKAFTTNDTRLPNGRKSQSIQPATSVGAEEDPEFLLSFDAHCPSSQCTGRKIVLFRIRVASGKLKLGVTRMGSGYVESSIGTQKGGSTTNSGTFWDTGDLRFANAFYDSDANRLFGAHAVAQDLDEGDGYIEAVNRWYEVTPTGHLPDSSISRTGFVGTPKTDAGWPVVATDQAGNLFLNYSRASAVAGAEEYLSSYAATVPPASTGADGILLLKAGEARYEFFPGPERWGDYNGINRDPVDGMHVWMINQYAKSTGGPVTLDFKQVVDEVSHI